MGEMNQDGGPGAGLRELYADGGQRQVFGGETGFATTKLEALLAWSRKYSLFQYPFATACCGMEFFAVASPRYDIARFGAEAPRFSPRQSDLLWVVGTISQRQAPILKRIYDQMADPKWVIAFGTCASCGGFYDNYATVPGIDKIIPTDVYIPGCPPRPEAVLDGLMLLMDKIQNGNREPAVLPVKELPDKLVRLRSGKTSEPTVLPDETLPPEVSKLETGAVKEPDDGSGAGPRGDA